MAGAGRRKKAAAKVDVAACVASALDALERDAVLKLSAIKPKQVQGEIIEALLARGYEKTKTSVRRSLSAQLSDALAQGSFIPLDKSVRSFARGGTQKEARDAAAELVSQGKARRAVRGKLEVLVPASAPVLSREEVTTTLRKLESLKKVLAKSQKSRGLTLLRQDATEALEEVLSALSQSAAVSTTQAQGAQAPERRTRVTEGAKSAEQLLHRVLAVVKETQDAQLGLSFIPDVMKRLAPELSAERVKTSLSQAAQRGWVELRPEGGLNRLTEEERALCLPGPQGTLLSWARAAKESGA